MSSRPDNEGRATGSEAQALRARIRDGGQALLDDLSERELRAMQSLLPGGEAEIVNSACHPYLVAKLDRVLLAP